MAENTEKSSIFNNAIVLLAILFTIPAALVVGATLITASYGRVPGGTTTVCERTVAEAPIRAELYRYQAGLTPYETQTFFVRDDGGEWVEFFKVDIQAPQDFSCEIGIREIDGTILIATQKGIALSHDSGAIWNIQTVCDEPRPTNNRCDKDPLNIVDITFNDAQNGTLVIEEAVTDEYGVVVLDENGDPRVINQYILVTGNAGESWNIASD